MGNRPSARKVRVENHSQKELFLMCGTNPPVANKMPPEYVGEHLFSEYVVVSNALSAPIGVYVTIQDGEPITYDTPNTGVAFDIDRRTNGDIKIVINESVGG